jgi:hypothetical protein
VPETTELERDLQQLEATLRRLETEYNQYFAGQLPRPPWDTRNRLEAMLRRFDRAYIQSAVDRFRLSTLQSRFSTFAELWDRGLRAREEGRPGPFFKPPRPRADPPSAPSAPSSADGEVGTATVSDMGRDTEKIEALYESLIEARRATGADEPFPFHRFAQIVKGQVAKLQQAGSREVAFRVSVKDGRVAFTAKGVKASDSESEE